MKEWDVYWKKDLASIGDNIYSIKTNIEKIDYGITYLGTDFKTIKFRLVEKINNTVFDTVNVELPLHKKKYAFFYPRRCYAMHDFTFEIKDHEGNIEINYQDREE